MGSWQGQQRARRAWCAWSLLSLGLAGCGKDGAEPPSPTPLPPQTFTIGGTVSGLVGSLTLLNNGGDARTVAADGGFTFPTALAAGTAYAISVQAQPADQNCVVSAGTGTVTAAVTGITVSCETVRASATIGTSGGTLLGPDGVQVEIPAGALTQDTLIGIARSGTDAPPAPTANLGAARVYEFTPHDLVFEAPVLIRMPVPAGATEPAALFAGVGADWMEVDALIEDGVAVIERNTFSWGGIYACAYLPGDPDLDPGGCVNPRGTLTLSATPANGLTTVAGAATPRRHRLTAAGTVHFTFSYHVAASCTNGTVRLRRTSVQDNGQTVQPLQILGEQPAPMLINNVAPPGRAADGSVMFNVPVSETDDGRWYYQAQLLCTHRTG
ncbi:MAG: surface antigen, partial [Steroidobacteraceae bacterium]|nr:surface antigen [Steroidobacteraceae bacterium]